MMIVEQLMAMGETVCVESMHTHSHLRAQDAQL